jgi:hypothetical protein
MTLAIRFIPNAGRTVIYAASHKSNEVGQGRERDVRSSPVMDDPDRRLTLCQADQSRNDFAVILDELASERADRAAAGTVRSSSIGASKRTPASGIFSVV